MQETAVGAPILSVVIGYKDWGLDRLTLAVGSHETSTIADRLEIIVVDYGSRDPDAARRALAHSKCRIIRAESQGRWSRSRALNIGIWGATGQFVLTTDSDILFKPTTHAAVVQSSSKGNTLGLVQCRNLPKGFPESALRTYDFSAMEKSSKLRRQVALGGCACFPRRWIEYVRGYDERMEWWGAEDKDIELRARRTGLKLRWVQSPDARIYHIWHPKIPSQMKGDPEFRKIRKRNRRIALTDKSVIRNSSGWGERR